MKLKWTIAALMCCALLCGCAARPEQGDGPTEPPTEQSAVQAFTSPITISEAMARNRSTLAAADGSFPDWIELYNTADEAVSLEGLYLSDEADGSSRSPLPERELPAHGFLLVFADGGESAAGEIHARFKLSEGESVYLSGPDGQLLDSLELTDGRADISVSRSDGDTVASAFATPGCANDVEGYRAFQASRVCASPLQISEVRVADYGIGYKSDEQHSDWVELRNVSDEAIRLSAYSLTDDSEQPEQYRLPDETLGPGAYFLLLCTDEYRWDQPTTGFSLDSERESLYLYENGRLADYAALHDIPYFGSLGRLPDENGYYYFEKPTPAAPNDGRAGRTISAPPTSPTRDGVYEGTGAVSVELRGAGRIYYTLDGSRPNETSSAYTGPITVDRSTVVRAVAVEDGALPSPPLTLSFFLNEGHTLPIVSIAGDSPGQVDTLLNRGSKAMEEPGNVSLYEGGERAFSLDCGFSLSGKSSIYEFPKKNVKVRLRSAYGADPVLRPLRHGRDGLRFVHPPCRAGCGLPPLQHRDLAGSLPGHV